MLGIFLFSGIAVPAMYGKIKRMLLRTKKAAEVREKKIPEARELSKKIEQSPCTIPVKVGEEEKIFGSVSAQENRDFLKKGRFLI
jgi:large subunit ribosomal protein L9